MQIDHSLPQLHVLSSSQILAAVLVTPPSGSAHDSSHKQAPALHSIRALAVS